MSETTLRQECHDEEGRKCAVVEVEPFDTGEYLFVEVIDLSHFGKPPKPVSACALMTYHEARNLARSILAVTDPPEAPR